MPAEPEKYVQKAQDCMDQFPPQVELAAKFYQKALGLAPTNTNVLDAFGEFLANCGQEETAVQLLMESCRLEPEKNSSKYMYLSQLKQGKESLECIERGIILLKKEIESKEVETDLGKSNLVSAYCSVAEIYMTDLCDEPEAEEKCKLALKEATEVDPASFEANAMCANFCKIIVEDEKAKVHCQTCMDYLEKHKENDELFPPAPVRASFCQTLLDLSLADHALTVAGTLLEEDDTDPHLWFLGATANAQAGEKEVASDCLERVKECVGKDVDANKELLEACERLANDITKIPDLEEEDAEVGA